MKHLFIYRHADTLPAAPGQTDHDRNLSEKGEQECALVGTFLKTNRIKPDIILCSSARRTQQTLELTTAALGQTFDTRIDDALYLASAWDIFHELNKLDDQISTAMIVAHNPGSQQICQLLAKKGDEVGQDAINKRFPPATLAFFRLDILRWKELVPVTEGELLGVAMPK